MSSKSQAIFLKLFFNESFLLSVALMLQSWNK